MRFCVTSAARLDDSKIALIGKHVLLWNLMRGGCWSWFMNDLIICSLKAVFSFKKWLPDWGGKATLWCRLYNKITTNKRTVHCKWNEMRDGKWLLSTQYMDRTYSLKETANYNMLTKRVKRNDGWLEEILDLSRAFYLCFLKIFNKWNKNRNLSENKNIKSSETKAIC